MPDNENIKYSYELDISSLQKGTERAVNLLQKQIDALTGVSNKTKSAEASAKAFEKAWLKASDKIAGTQEKISRAMAAAQREADKYLAQSSKQSYTPTNTQKQIEALTGVSNKAKSAEASAKAFEKAWLNASGKVSQKNKQTAESVSSVAQQAKSSTASTQSAFLRLSQTVSSIRQPVQQAFEPITSKLGVMARMIDPNISAKLQSFKDKAQDAFGRTSGLLNQVSSAFRRTQQSTDDGSRSTQTFAQRMSRLGAQCKKAAPKLAEISKSARGVADFFGRCAQKTRAFASALSNANKSTSLLRTALKGLAAERVAEALSEGVRQSISYVENLNLFTVAMGKAVDEGNKFVDTMQELYGMDPSNIMRYAGNFYQLATAIEMPSESATKLSLGLTKMTNDISSLFNVDIETVFENMSSGLQGMSRAVTKYGMDIRKTTLQQKALSLGITENVASMSEANRIGLRYIVMMEQAANATGDFAANIETPANQLRIFKEQMTQLGRAIGDFFIVPLRTALQYVNGFIMAVRSILVFIRKLLGLETDFQTRTGGVVDSLGGASDGIDAIGNSAADATKELKGMLAPFDELNVISQKTSDASSGLGGLGGGSSDLLDPRIADAIANLGYQFEDIEMKANKVRNAILDFLGFKVEDGTILSWDSSQFEANLINKFPQWTKTIQATFDNWTAIVEGFKSVFGSIGNVFVAAWEKYKESWAQIVNDDSVSTYIQGLADSLNNLSSWITEHSDTLSSLVEKIMWFATALLALKALSPVFSGIATGFSLLFKVIQGGLFGFELFSKLASGLPALLSAITSPVGLIVAAVLLLTATSEDFRESLGKLISSVMDLVGAILEPIIELLGVIVDNLLPPLLEIIGAIGDALAPVIDLLAEVISGLVPIVSEVIGFIADVIGDFIKSLSGVFEGVRDFIQGIAQIIRGVVDVIAGILTGDFKRIGNGLLTIIAGVLNAISGAIEAVLNVIITAVNSAISLIWRLLMGAINGLLSGVQEILSWVGVDVNLQVNWATPQIPKVSIPKVQAPGYADGGFPEKGTYFRALENGFGSEMIGSVGGRTAVANNEQIENAIAQAVYAVIMNTGLIEYIRSIERSSRETAEKDFTLGNPSATAGRWIKQSTDAYDKVRG